jgi:hypothetical protein
MMTLQNSGLELQDYIYQAIALCSLSRTYVPALDVHAALLFKVFKWSSEQKCADVFFQPSLIERPTN